MRTRKFPLYLVACFITVTSFSSKAQSPEFGVFTPKEKSLQEVEFDKQADAVRLFDIATASYTDDFKLAIERRIRIKILKEKGVEYANVEIPVYKKDDFEDITNLQAVVYTPGNNGLYETQELKRSDIFTKKINDYYSQVKFALPNVKVGSIIEYRYQDNYKNFNGLDNWYFQTELPTLLSRFFLAVPPRAEFAYSVHKSEDLPIGIDNKRNDGSVIFEMENIAGLRGEPYMDAAKDYLQHVDFQLSAYIGGTGNKVNYLNKWSDVSKELMNASYFGKQLDKSLAKSEELLSGFKAKPNEDQKVKGIFDYVRSKFDWNGVRSKYTDDGVKELWEKGTGASAEINLLLVNLLKNAGIEAYPLLVSDRLHGKVSTSYPLLQQFNSTMAYVQMADRFLVLDATNQSTPFNLIPENVLNTTAYLVDTKKGKLVTLTDIQSMYSNTVNVYTSIDAAGIMKGQASITSADYSRINRTKDYKKDKEQFKKDYLAKDVADIIVDSVVVTGLDSDSLPLSQTFKFTLPASISGDYKLINFNMFTGFEKNPFINDNRFSDINFGNRQLLSLVEEIELAEDLKPDDLPKNVQLVLPDRSLSMTRQISMVGKSVFVRLSLIINKPVFSADEYPMVKEFYKKMYSYLDEPIVLTNK